MRIQLLSVAFGLSLLSANALIAGDKLIILSPHRKSIQDEFVPAFREYYKKNHKGEVEVDWIDQGGTADDIRFLRTKFKANPASSGIDIFWGGGLSTYLELKDEKFFANYELPKALAAEIPQNIAGVPFYDDSKTWYASAMSSFGLFYNQKILKFEGMPEPKSWDDLGDPKFLDQVIQTDPRRSGTFTTMNMIILQGRGWEKAWQTFHRIAGNTKKFSHSSTDPIKAVVAGDAAATMAIDFYANAKVSELGPQNLGFVMPTGETILDPDPAAILKGAPNAKVAQAFLDFLLNAETQKLLVLPKGKPGGPVKSDLGRMASNRRTYEETKGQRISDFDPFAQKKFLKLDEKRASKEQRVVSDLIGAVIIDQHTELKAAWQAMLKSKNFESLMTEFAAMPLQEKDLPMLAEKWEDEVFRNQQINEWMKFAKAKYAKILKKNS